MLMRKKTIIIIGMILLIITIITLSSIRIFHLNSRFPNPQIIEHSVGEIINGGETSFQVLDSELLSGADIKQLFPDYIDPVENSDGSKVSDDQIYALFVHAKLINNSNVTQKMVLVQMYAQSLIWFNGIDGRLYPLLNPDAKNPMEISLEPGQEIEVTIPYSMYNFQYTAEDWNNITNRKFELIISFYPEQHIINLV